MEQNSCAVDLIAQMCADFLLNSNRKSEHYLETATTQHRHIKDVESSLASRVGQARAQHDVIEKIRFATHEVLCSSQEKKCLRRSSSQQKNFFLKYLSLWHQIILYQRKCACADHFSPTIVTRHVMAKTTVFVIPDSLNFSGKINPQPHKTCFIMS